MLEPLVAALIFSMAHAGSLWREALQSLLTSVNSCRRCWQWIQRSVLHQKQRCKTLTSRKSQDRLSS